VRPAKELPGEGAAVEGGGLKAARPGEALARVVFVVGEDGKAHVRRVRTGIASDTALEILEGLQQGEKVVDGPYRTLARELKDGARVEEGDGAKRPRGRG
jgi:HlyD family secretion protein